jgi:hypothetical protein
LQGYASHPLKNLTFDVSNAAGIFTNQTGFLTGQFYDTNLLAYTTNYFECDIDLDSGTNLIALHATDWAGNTTNVNLTLDYSPDTNAPSLSLLWPPNNTPIGGSNVTIQAQVSDATATVTATVNGNTVQGLIERSGLVWLQNLPLNGGTNIITITSQNAAGKVSTNTLDVVESSVNLSIDPISDDQLNQTNVTVTGSVSDPAADVWVNGIEVGWYDDNDWYADNVPVSASGTAIVTVEAGTDLSHVEASETLDEVQPAEVVLAGYSYLDNTRYDSGWSTYSVDWAYDSGGTYETSGYDPDGNPGYENYHVEQNLPSDGPGFAGADDLGVLSWDYFSVNTSYADDEGGTVSFQRSSQAQVVIAPSGQEAAGTTNVYLVLASAMAFSDPVQSLGEGAGDMPVAPETMAVNGQALVNTGITNYNGSVFGATIVSGSSGAPAPLVTTAAASAFTFTNRALPLHLAIIDTNSGTDLTLQTNSVIVGQQMNLQCRLSMTNSFMTNFPLANFKWTIPGYAISNYVADGQSGVVYTNFSITSSNVNFYWVDGGIKQVQISATVNGQTITGQAAFNVLRPTATVTTTTATVAVTTAWGDLEIAYGTPAQFGITFTNSITMPNGFSGTNEWVQEITSTLRRAQTNDGSGAWYRLQASGVLDTHYPYPPISSDSTRDAPGQGLNSQWQNISISDNFNMWLMFKPTGGQWVPLKVVTWNWGGTASQTGGVWTLNSSNNIVNPVGVDSLTYPSWTNSIVNFNYQKE